MLVKLALHSLMSRKSSVLLTLFALTLSLFVLMAVDQIRLQAKQSFSRTVSGVDLIVGGRTGASNLLLSSVFHLGYNATSVSAQSLHAISNMPMVDWLVPLSLGDSHKGYRVIGTTAEFFLRFHYGKKQALRFSQGHALQNGKSYAAQVVLGSKVANQLGYRVGSLLTLSHGLGVTSFHHHDHVEFAVVGVLANTGTPVDQALYVNLEGIMLMHDQSHETTANVVTHSSSEHDQKHEPDQHSHDEHEHHHTANTESVGQSLSDNALNYDLSNSDQRFSAALVGVRAKYATLMVQKQVNDFSSEPLMAIIPGVVLTELWQIMANVEVVLWVIAILVLFSAMIGMSTMLLASMRERQAEISVFRALGASPWFVFALIQLEVLFITLLSAVLSFTMLWMLVTVLSDWLASSYGLYLDGILLGTEQGIVVGGVVALALVIGMLPAINAYRSALGASLKGR